MKIFQANTSSASFNVMDDEAVIIHTETSAYFSMNQTGTYLWSLMVEKNCSSEYLENALSSACKHDINTIGQDVNAFLEMLINADLVIEQSDSNNSPTLITHPNNEMNFVTYEAPDLVKFGDLETLILSGE